MPLPLTRPTARLLAVTAAGASMALALTTAPSAGAAQSAGTGGAGTRTVQAGTAPPAGTALVPRG